MEIKRFVCRVLSENSYVLSEGDSCVVVDPGFYGQEELGRITGYLDGRVPDAILLTHGHFDHCLGAKPLQDAWPGVPVYMHPADEPIVHEAEGIMRSLNLHGADFSFRWIPVSDGQTISFGSLSFKVIATLGHTPGGVCWYCESLALAFTGDTLFADAIGRTDFPYSDYDSEIRSIMEKLVLLPGATDVFPGHGGPTTIERERSSNPFLEPFNEPGETFDEDLPGIELKPF